MTAPSVTTRVRTHAGRRSDAAVPALRPREDPDLAGRLALSAETDGAKVSTRAFDAWFAGRRRAHAFRVTPRPLTALKGWSFAEDTGNLVHDSGRFFAVEGLRVRNSDATGRSWEQPIIRQHEVGVLGVLAKEFDGVLHFLMQAKMEPGNWNLLQLSPTVQATRSNFTGAHGGASVRHLDHFAEPGRGRTLIDVLQSEHGSWFHHKSNRNMVVETDADISAGDDFCWLTLKQIHALLRRDDVVNMDARSVFACLPYVPPTAAHGPQSAFLEALAASADHGAGTLTPTAEWLGWFTGLRSDRTRKADLVALDEVGNGWVRDRRHITRQDRRHFDVVGVRVEAASREVAGWDQPLFAPHGTGVVAFVCREFAGVLHLLVQAKGEAGFADSVQLAPTVQCVPQNHDESHQPFLLDHVLSATPDRIRYDAIHSEEGGRFLNARSRHLIVEANAADRLGELPPDFSWVTIGQLTDLLRHGNYVNVQARTLIACLGTLR